MPKASIRFAESAVADLEEIKSWYADQGAPEAGARLVAEILERIESLSSHPDLGRMVPEFGQSFLREVIHPPFRIVYRRDRRTVRVVRVWRSERKLSLGGEVEDR